MMPEYDFYSCGQDEEGEYVIFKNGEPFLRCTGSLGDAEEIVRNLNNDVKRMAEDG